MKTMIQRLKQAKAAREVAQGKKILKKDLAKAAGVSSAAVSNWWNNENTVLEARCIFGLAKLLEISPEWLQSGRGPMSPSAEHKSGTRDASINDPKSGLIKDLPTNRSHRIGEPSVHADANVLPRDIPILSYEKAGQMTPLVDPWTHDEDLGKVTINKPYSLSTFAIPIRDASMHPRFEEGLDFPIIDPTRPAAPSKCVLARTRTGETVFRKYREIGMNERGEMVFELAPVNDDFATLHSERDGLVIIGRMVAYTHYEEE